MIAIDPSSSAQDAAHATRAWVEAHVPAAWRNAAHAGGPAAITGKLASNSRLSADEIETRLGPPAGASWELQTVVPALKDKVAVFTISYPSGIDETATFKLVNENGSYRIADIGILAQRTETKPVFAALVEQKKSADDGARQRPAAAGVLAALMCACAFAAWMQ
jgi:hypothetical protein